MTGAQSFTDKTGVGRVLVLRGRIGRTHKDSRLTRFFVSLKYGRPTPTPVRVLMHLSTGIFEECSGGRFGACSSSLPELRYIFSFGVLNTRITTAISLGVATGLSLFVIGGRPRYVVLERTANITHGREGGAYLPACPWAGTELRFPDQL